MRLAYLALPALLLAVPLAAEEPAPPTRDQAEELLGLYHGLDIEALAPRLAEDLTYLDVAPGTRHDREGFLAMLEEMAREGSKSEVEVQWAEVAGDTVDLRGVWVFTSEEGGEKRLNFSIELTFDDAGQVASWRDDLRFSNVHKPIRGNRRLETEHFELVYLAEELTEAEAERLGRTMESWYERTAEYLARSFEPGRRLHINVAGCHASPYASAPGPAAFILVPIRSAREEYGFSLVHELTHNLMGLSRLYLTQRSWEGLEFREGNRLLDEGFAVYVEEHLTGKTEMFPNWGHETHAGYRRIRSEQGQPIWPILAAEHYRSHRKHRGRFTRLAYLQQASFCKYLIETHGLERFVKLYESGLEAVESVYGKDLTALETDWLAFLEERFSAGQ